MARFYDLFMSFMIIGLGIFSIFAFIVSFQEENDVEDKFIEDKLVNETYSNLKSNLDSLRDDSQAQKTLFESENPTSGFGTILLFSIVSAGKVFNAMVVGIFNTIIKLPIVILGINPVVVSVLSTMLVISIIIGLWIVYKLGG